MAWAIAIAFLAIMLVWIVTGFIGEMLEYRRRRDVDRARSWPPRR